ncbi:MULTISPECIES: LysR family transcriptional regulator [Buttiauxella]|jgi:DNA-binding transcriptional LysR family regulator|uniref:LysR family transcriptional regulator n=1 Tax=Buttiauxella ferragutiae ATCC 51602 TaxID=1354252 RepID=A0ABX2WAB6_9ENTR|nr:MULTISPECIES: LysR family transcriptional regulator [Buttiauxella]MCE0825725.1 LysR family transcriptional regulator [Buttiauxella ferragutiae]OAT29245.1 LysR family transcriptional regulator [Buttiauxella ferragutiae ATCC 51602]
MDIKLLRAFITLADTGNYHAASEILYLTQPTLTKQIQALEHLLGTSLFQRGRYGAKLTISGKQLYPCAGDLLKQYDEFLIHALNIQKLDLNKLALGFGISSFQIAPACVNILREQHPNAEVSLSNIPSSVQSRMLLEGQLQAGFIRLPVAHPLRATVLMEEKLVLAVPSGTRVDSSNIQHLLNRYQLLQVNSLREPCLAGQVDSFLKENNLTASSTLATDDIHSLLALIAGGNGVALLPQSVSHFLPTGVTLVQLEARHSGWQIGIAWNPQIQNVLRDKFLQIVFQE